MHPLAQALLTRWEWRIEVISVLILMGTLYYMGWRSLRSLRKRPRLASRVRLSAYVGGLLIVAVALLSSIDRLGSQLFFMHMLQHLLLIMVAAPLLWLGNPFPVTLWAFPRPMRLGIATLFTKDALFRRGLSKATQPMVAWFTFIIIFFAWHDPNLYTLSLRREWVHNLQHITFMGAALLYWWPIIGSAPRIHGHFPGWAKMAYLILTVPPNMLLGVSIAFATTIIYPYYESAPRIWGFTAMQDQMISGAIMWIPGSMMYILAALIVLARMFPKRRDTAALLQASEWDREQAHSSDMPSHAS